MALVHLHDGAVDAHSDAHEHAHHHGDADEDCLMSDVLGGAVLRMLDGDFSLELQESLSEPLFPLLTFVVLSTSLPNYLLEMEYWREAYEEKLRSERDLHHELPGQDDASGQRL